MNGPLVPLPFMPFGTGEAPSDAVARVTRLRPGSQAALVAVAYADGLSGPIPLPGSALVARVPDFAPDGATWVVTCTARPADDLGQVLAAIDAAGDAALAALFGVAPAEPYRTWKAIWYSDAPPPYRLGAALLALAARTDDLRGAA